MIDVIVPVFNNSETIEETLASIVRQSIFRESTIRIVDDASRDSSYELARQWARRYPNILVERNETNLGVMGNYRRLVSMTRGKYVAPIEGDDVWLSSTRLEKLMEYLERTRRPACFNGFLVDDRISGQLEPNPLMGSPRFLRLSAFDMLKGNPPASFSNCIYHRDVLASCLERTINAAGYDWLVNTLIAERCDGLDFFPEVLSAYRISATGAWSSLPSQEKKSLIVATLKSLRGLLPRRFRDSIDRQMSV